MWNHQKEYKTTKLETDFLFYEEHSTSKLKVYAFEEGVIPKWVMSMRLGVDNNLFVKQFCLDLSLRFCLSILSALNY
jgi:hypothetical protein